MMDCGENAVIFSPVSQAQCCNPRENMFLFSGAYSFLLSTNMLVLLFI